MRHPEIVCVPNRHSGAEQARCRRGPAPGHDPSDTRALGFVEAGLVGLLTLAGVDAATAAVATFTYRLISF